MINLIYAYARYKKDRLKRLLDLRGQQLWFGPKPQCLELSDLAPADIIFCGPGKKGKRTELIQSLTDGVYVHCAIYVGEGKVIEMTKSKGCKVSTIEDFINNYRYLAVGRYPGMYKYRARAVIRYAKLCYQKRVKYNTFGAMLLPLREYSYLKTQCNIGIEKVPKPPKASKRLCLRKRFFCSEFVVQCFKASGYIPKDDYFSISHYFSPTSLVEDKTFPIVGYMSKNGLQDVDHHDPHLGGCHYALK